MSGDIIHRFSFTNAPIRGQWVRLSNTLTEVYSRQDYPEPARRLIAEMLAAVALVADGLKFQGAVALQSRGNGPVRTTLAECRHRNLLRGIIRLDEDTPADLGTPDAGTTPEAAAAPLTSLLGEGLMTITLIPDTERSPDAAPYQGVVELADDSLARNLEQYFSNSEQLPTRLFIACSGDPADPSVTGMLLQRLPVSEPESDLALDASDDAWREIELLAETVTPGELADLPMEDLLGRLFHQHTVAVHPGRSLEFACTCSRERAGGMLGALPKEEIIELLETRGMVDVTCEVCGTRYEYDRIDTHAVYAPETPRIH